MTMSDLTSKLVSGEVVPSDLVTKALIKKVRKVPHDTTLGRVSLLLDTESFVAVTVLSGETLGTVHCSGSSTSSQISQT